jgi:putative ABC transport system permease protein
VYVINVQSFGWTIQFHLPVAFMIQSSLTIVAATGLAGLYPAYRASRLTMGRDE